MIAKKLEISKFLLINNLLSKTIVSKKYVDVLGKRFQVGLEAVAETFKLLLGEVLTCEHVKNVFEHGIFFDFIQIL